VKPNYLAVAARLLFQFKVHQGGILL